MELANWGRKIFFRNCKPNFLQNLRLIFFNRYLSRHLVTSAELFASSILCLAPQIGKLMRLIRHSLHLWKSRLWIQTLKKILHLSYQCLNQQLFISNKFFSRNSPVVNSSTEKFWFETAKLLKFLNFLFKICSAFPKNQWLYFNYQGIIGSWWQLLKNTGNSTVAFESSQRKLSERKVLTLAKRY